MRPTTGELVIFRLADAGIVARWPIGELAVLGDIQHEASPPIVRKGGEARLLVEDPATAPPARRARARNSRRWPRRRRPSGAASLPSPPPWRLLSACSGSPSTTAASTPHRCCPTACRPSWARASIEELTADKDECHGEAGLAALSGLANRLAHAADYPHEITVHVIEGGPVNAYTLPGGVLVVYSDLIDQAKDSSQVAGVVAHEIGHAVHYHPMKGLARQYGVEVLVKLVSGGYSDLLSTLASGGNILLALRNGRAFERDADATGVALLEKLGLRADGIASFFEQMMEKEPKDMAAAAGIWSSHPPTAERIAATKRPATGRPAFSDAEWKALRAVCK